MPALPARLYQSERGLCGLARIPSREHSRFTRERSRFGAKNLPRMLMGSAPKPIGGVHEPWERPNFAKRFILARDRSAIGLVALVMARSTNGAATALP